MPRRSVPVLFTLSFHVSALPVPASLGNSRQPWSSFGHISFATALHLSTLSPYCSPHPPHTTSTDCSTRTLFVESLTRLPYSSTSLLTRPINRPIPTPRHWADLNLTVCADVPPFTGYLLPIRSPTLHCLLSFSSLLLRQSPHPLPRP